VEDIARRGGAHHRPREAHCGDLADTIEASLHESVDGLEPLPDDRPGRAASALTWSQRLLSVLVIAAGTLHFARPEMYVEIMPDYLPAHGELVLVSGAAEIAGGVAVVFPRTRRLAGWWLALVLVAIFPANVHMALHPDRYPSLAPALLWARLPLQLVFASWVLRTTRR
jgi:uncharacterized membrane protein